MISVLNYAKHNYQGLSIADRKKVENSVEQCIQEAMRPMIGFRVDQDLKEFFEKLAKKENRSLSNFIINAILTYIKEHHGIDWHKVKDKPKK